MAYFEDRALRAHRDRSAITPDLSRVAGIALLFAVVATLIVWTAPTTGTAPDGQDWHGNVAASAERG